MVQKIPTVWLIIIGLVLAVGGGYWFWVDDIKPYLAQKNYYDDGLCGLQPPALCRAGLGLECNKETRKWECSPTSESESVDTDISDWKTYRNEKYGFELKYPSNIVLESFQIGSGDGNDTVITVLGASFPRIFSVSYLGRNANQAARRMEQRVDLENKFFQNLDTLMEDRGWWDHKDSKRINVDGKIAYESNIHQGNDYEVLIESNGIYQLQFPSEILNLDFSIQGRQILSTFKFIEPKKEEVIVKPPPPPICGPQLPASCLVGTDLYCNLETRKWECVKNKTVEEQKESTCYINLTITGDKFTPNYCEYLTVTSGVPCADNMVCQADTVIVLRDTTYPKDRMSEMVFYNIMRGQTDGVYKYNATQKDFKGYLFQAGGLSRHLIEADLKVEPRSGNMVYVSFTSEFAENIKISGSGSIPVKSYSAP